MMFNVPHRRQSAMVDQQVVNKENVPPQVRSNMTTQKPIRTNRVHTINPRGKWSNKSLEIAMDAVERGITSLQGPNKFWDILGTSLSDHLIGKTRSRKIGQPSVLT
jgi:hypothetical protein